jgi:glucose-1-phosphate cytidylyltransferase
MKVVLFCGGMGMRLREFSEAVPKPLVGVGRRPILWNLMKYYAHYGHKDFILCLGHQGEAIKQYFLDYNEALANDFVLSAGGRTMQLMNRDIEEWTITFADTGMQSNIGQRLRAVRHYLEGEEVFLANYADGLSDLPLPDAIAHFHAKKAIACFLTVKPSQSFDIVRTGPGDAVEALEHVTKADLWVNAGFFTLRHEIFDYLREGEELVYEPFQRLMKEGRLFAYRHHGFFMAMDTFKEKQAIDEMAARGDAPWEVWKASKAPGTPGRTGKR